MATRAQGPSPQSQPLLPRCQAKAFSCAVTRAKLIMLRGEGDAGERVVLSRGDTCLREADVELLRGPHWLNDQLVTFYFTHLAESQPDDSALLLGGSVRTSLVRPRWQGA